MSYSHYAPAMVMIQKSISTKRPSMTSSVVVMCTGSNISINATRFQIRLPPTATNKVVFEDESNGIVCYSNENGEIICEGIDEGPRFQRLNSNSSAVSNSRDAEIIDLLKNWWLKTGGDW